MVANNVFAHVPDILDFARGFSILLAPEGVATFEFPHLLHLVNELQFDTIYHEHYSYLSLTSAERVLGAAGLRVFDAEELPTHGGSLRLFTCHQHADYSTTPRVADLRAREHAAGLDSRRGYESFAPRVADVVRSFRDFLDSARAEGKKVAAYGAAAKGNTFLNVAGVTHEDIVCVFDRNTTKQGKLLPGSHIPILSPDQMGVVRPDYVVILPWNISNEIVAQNGISEWGGKFVVAIPSTRVLEHSPAAS
jgi:hypothetical protein